MRRLMQAGILLCLMVMAGCAKDENLLDNENLSQNLSSEMKLVKDKFDKQYYTGLQTRTSSEEFRSMFIDLKPDWENAIEEENDDEKVILVPIRVKGIEININYECSQRYNETKDERYLNTRMLLCFKVNKKTKKEDFFFMSFAPSESYLVKNNFDLTNNFYFKRDKNYDGKVIYHDINSNFVNGWEYQKGKITAFEYPKLNNKSAVTTRSNSEEIVCYESWRVTVTTYYYSVNGGPLHYNFSRVESSSDQFCVFANPTGNRPGVTWVDDSDGSGIGGGGYTPPNKQLPKYATISSNFLKVASLSPEEVCKLIGGKVQWNYQNTTDFKNACAIRLSYAFNQISGHQIPYTPNQTVSGNDSHWYFYRVTDMVAYLRYNYGDPVRITSDMIKGKKGIIWQSDCGWGDASGHLDIWNDTNALQKYYTICEDLYFWEIK